MNLIDAIRSGKEFRRPLWPDWLSPYTDGGVHAWTFMELDILANDWEVKSPEVTITKDQAEKAFLEIAAWAADRRWFGHRKPAIVAFQRALAILGFK